MLRGKSAIVTGATSGIGLAIAETLAAQGARLVVNGLGEAAAIEAIRARLAATSGSDVLYSNADMQDPQAIAAMMQEAITRFGSVDILVNNAGVQHVAPVEAFPPAQWDRILAVNLSSAFHTIRSALPAMRDKGWGRIVNIASAHGLVASPFKSAYIAAKHGLVGLTKTVALETARQGITCNAVCPGYVLTPLVERQIDDQARAHGIPREAVIEKVILERQPSKQFVRTQDVADLVAYLCSESAAGITGAALSIDGGWVAQ